MKFKRDHLLLTVLIIYDYDIPLLLMTTFILKLSIIGIRATKKWGADAISPENHISLNGYKLSIISLKFYQGGSGGMLPRKNFKILTSKTRIITPKYHYEERKLSHKLPEY